MPALPHLLALLLLTSLFAPVATAQLSITQSTLLAQLGTKGTVMTYETAQPGTAQALADRVGANQTWDFTALSFTPTGSYALAPAALPVPGATTAMLARATHAQQTTLRDSSAYALYRVTPGAFEAVGFSGEARIDGKDSTFAFSYSPERLVFPLPLTAQSTWTTRYQFDIGQSIPGISVETEEQAAVEGWGTLVTPAGSFPTLKVRAKYVTISTVALAGQPPMVIRDSSYAITFYTASVAQAFLFLDRTGTVLEAEYTSVRNATDAEATPAPQAAHLAFGGAQPARTGTPVPVRMTLDAPAPVRLEAFDVQGRRVALVVDRFFGAGEQEVAWRTDSLAPGVYVVRLTTPGAVRSRPLVLVR